MADVKMYLTIFTLVLAFLFHVIGFATPNWSKDIYHGYTTTWGLWEVCPPPKYEACSKRYLPPSSHMFWYTTITRILECVALFFFFIAPLIAGYLTYHANKGRNVTRGWRRTCTEPFGNACVVIIALVIYGIMQDAILDYSFFLTCVSALLSIIAGILGFSVKFPQRRTQNRAKNGVQNDAMIVTTTPTVSHQGSNSQMAPQAAYPPQFNQVIYPSYGMALAMYKPQYHQGEMNQAYAMVPIAYGPQFYQGYPNSSYGMAPTYEPKFNSTIGNESAPPPYEKPSTKEAY